ncbi:MAG: YciI family protein [Actinomyces sp.]|uniref:YciI family protein n=1 Tax=Actinomyces sp. TaxID=29317 RepID=UPI0026DB5998|nr:YciI family protein [Actinomyces sp.]MDO4243726.1 YciI family protein [Actinomyces sp.]
MSTIYAVEYRYVTDQDEELDRVRPAHRAFNAALADRGRLLAAGPYVGTHDALIIVRAEDAADALALLADDPFQQAGLIAERLPREWNPVIGVLSAAQ